MEESVFAEWVAGLRAAIKEARGESKMNKKWQVDAVSLNPTPPPIKAVDDDGYNLTIRYNGTAVIRKYKSAYEDFRLSFQSADDVDTWIEKLRELKALAEAHFGEDWGE